MEPDPDFLASEDADPVMKVKPSVETALLKHTADFGEDGGGVDAKTKVLAFVLANMVNFILGDGR